MWERRRLPKKMDRMRENGISRPGICQRGPTWRKMKELYCLYRNRQRSESVSKHYFNRTILPDSSYDITPLAEPKYSYLNTIITFCPLSIVLILFKTPSCFHLNPNVSEIGFCLRLQVEPAQLGLIDRTSPKLRTPAPIQDRVYKPSTEQTICES
jgi:hypothetical protein